jgi:PAS domain S-box-containing protein
MTDHDIPMAENDTAITSDFAEIEKKLKKNQDRLTAAFLKHPTPVAISTLKDGRYVDVNEAFAKSMGYKREELIGQTSTGCGYITLDGRALVLQQFREKGYCENLELPIRVKGGELRHGLFNSAKMKLGNEEYLLTVVTDVTDRKIVEEALQLSEERFRDFFQNANVGATQVTPDGRILRINDRAAKLFGYNSAEEMKNAVEDVRTSLYVNPERRQEGERLLRQQGYLENFEAECRRKDGSKFWISYDTRAVQDSQGNITYYDAISHDVTDRKHAEAMLRKSEERFALLANGTFEGILIQKDGIIIDTNNTVTRLFDYEHDEVIGENIVQFVAPESYQLIPGKLKEGGNKQELHYEALGRRKDSTVFPVEIISKPVQYMGIEARVVAVRDITERKKNELELQQAEKILQKSHEDLEVEVVKRTAELREINAQMIEEIEERVKIEDELLVKSANLKEMNTALNVLIKNKEENRLDIEKKVLANAKEIILPYLTKLKNSRLDPVQSNLADIIERGVNDIISPFMQSLKSHYTNLTCRETEIIDLIKEGKTTKEITEIIGISERSIDGHRLNIRKKLGLNNKNANLRNFLVSLS